MRKRGRWLWKTRVLKMLSALLLLLLPGALVVGVEGGNAVAGGDVGVAAREMVDS